MKIVPKLIIEVMVRVIVSVCTSQYAEKTYTMHQQTSQYAV